jgi:hypothetical protein
MLIVVHLAPEDAGAPPPTHVVTRAPNRCNPGGDWSCPARIALAGLARLAAGQSLSTRHRSFASVVWLLTRRPAASASGKLICRLTKRWKPMMPVEAQRGGVSRVDDQRKDRRLGAQCTHHRIDQQRAAD